MDAEQHIKAVRIAEKNDHFRRNMTGCTVTPGITALGALVNDVFVRVREVQDFTEENDPYHEHDFGSFEIAGITVFWKIDYYDADQEHWCDPLDPACNRVLTVMRADEY